MLWIGMTPGSLYRKRTGTTAGWSGRWLKYKSEAQGRWTGMRERTWGWLGHISVTPVEINTLHKTTQLVFWGRRKLSSKHLKEQPRNIWNSHLNVKKEHTNRNNICLMNTKWISFSYYNMLPVPLLSSLRSTRSNFINFRKLKFQIFFHFQIRGEIFGIMNTSSYVEWQCYSCIGVK